ncbi:hypothetical protein LCY76_02335 [Fictibacillus sp. KIGAM418]|uniref:Uncharacterized protein n=1 Tax=Fictibacillus marinisediminis TaxID=2878389 RepID=A0A9X2BFG9_9BACL|nr:hypothetical protein [Fictibacillus marinisediminis]MCK6255463.1 hypothetical protein [Fictibacillus marinisediminis]
MNRTLTEIELDCFDPGAAIFYCLENAAETILIAEESIFIQELKEVFNKYGQIYNEIEAVNDGVKIERCFFKGITIQRDRFNNTEIPDFSNVACQIDGCLEELYHILDIINTDWLLKEILEFEQILLEFGEKCRKAEMFFKDVPWFEKIFNPIVFYKTMIESGDPQYKNYFKKKLSLVAVIKPKSKKIHSTNRWNFSKTSYQSSAPLFEHGRSRNSIRVNKLFNPQGILLVGPYSRYK